MNYGTLKKTSLTGQGIQAYIKTVPCNEPNWHHHEEYELIYLPDSSGVRYVGDEIEKFSAGELVLLGPHVPHLWKNDTVSNRLNTIVIKFRDDFAGKDTFQTPIFRSIQKMLEQSKLGLKFGVLQEDGLFSKITNLPQLAPVSQVIGLLDVLNDLCNCDWDTISVTDMRANVSTETERIEQIIKFISDNYYKDIDLEQVANMACLTKSSFCRYFKKMTNRSFIDYLSEVRVRQATRLLINKNMTISQVCHSVGFNSISNFNRKFKKVTGRSPKMLRTDSRSTLFQQVASF
ncbi:AraC family transcriptional regulator [Reichenbachiella versicolor]|uniref:AraC family transcriptional regulator n=1 Tax=Reichenbachiella versicolor TaxID=1821036 RepID=UPI000D6E41F3|nr:AraC family transcriptional regulator [Reichenbachiella versicolor]